MFLQDLHLHLDQNLPTCLCLLDLLQDLHLQVQFVRIISSGALLKDLMPLEASTTLLPTSRLRIP